MGGPPGALFAACGRSIPLLCEGETYGFRPRAPTSLAELPFGRWLANDE